MDFSNIKVGDLVTIRAKVETITGGIVEIGFPSAGSHFHKCYIPAHIIASHAQPPWIPEKGDTVKWDSYEFRDWEIIAVHNEFAWIMRAGAQSLVGFDHLTLVHKRKMNTWNGGTGTRPTYFPHVTAKDSS